MNPQNIGHEFIERTKYQYLGQADQNKGIAPPPLELLPLPSARIIALPVADELPVYSYDLTTAFRERRSLRHYSDTPLSLAELTYLLWHTQGVVRASSISTLRTVPSAGARHPFETFLLVNNVTGLVPGLYRYVALSHSLAEVDMTTSVQERVVAACLGQKFAGTSAVTFIWVAVPYRTCWRYQERGYRYLHIDAGHVCQNLYLASLAIGGGCCAIAAFDDDAINAVVGADGVEQFVIYVAPVGKK